MEAKVVFHADVPLKDLGGGVSRRVLAYNEQLMIVEVNFEEGAVGAAHTHPHWQNTYVKSGKFRFTIDGADTEVAAGDTIAFPSGILHGTLCLEKGTLLDIFTPMREDFV
ncbi:MAG: cupin domain-containing protein [Clostridia bacterium]|nr:cupin domain-containing protein [Clostridia bacterium]MBR4443852.1 cupin domain-containing protein [Clostridia bacterium]